MQTKISGLCIFLISPLLVLAELTGYSWAMPDAIAALLAKIVLEFPRVGWVVRLFVVIGLAMAAIAVLGKRARRPGEQLPTPEGTGRDTLPLLLLAWLMASVGGVHIILGVSATYAAMIAVPLIATGWIGVQFGLRRGLGRHVGARAWHYVGTELSDYRQELVLLVMSGFIGTLGASLLLPLVGDFSGSILPAPVLLLAILWLIPVTGQIGMNPILTVSLLVPLLPSVDQLGITPTMLILTITSGWALGTMSSPFTATTLLVGRIANVSARRVGAIWNGPYTLVGGMVLSIWRMAFYHL